MKKKVFITVLIVLVCIAGVFCYKLTREYAFYPDDGIYFKMSETALKIKEGAPNEMTESDITQFHSLSYKEMTENCEIEKDFEFAPAFLGSQLQSVYYEYKFNNQEDADNFYAEIKERVKNYYEDKSGYSCEETENRSDIFRDRDGATGIGIELLKVNQEVRLSSVLVD